MITTLSYLNDDGSKASETDTRYTPGESVIDNETKLNWTYDNDDRLIEEQLSTVAGTDGPTPYDDQFGYDLDNNRTQEDIDGGEGTTGGSTFYYEYNGDDQLTYQHEHIYSEGELDHTSFTYDASGNQISQVYHHANYGVTYNTDSTTTYTYTLRNQMSSMTTTTTITDTSGADNPQTTTSKTTNYTYDTNGTLASETNYVGTTAVGTANAVTVYYLNDANNPTGYTKAIQLSSTPGGNPTLSYVLGLRVEAQSNSTNGTLYLMTDGHGSTRALVTSIGFTIEQYDYDAYGDMTRGIHIVLNTGSPPTYTVTTVTADTALTVWFEGDGFYDPSSGLTNHNARLTDGPRFITRDDIPQNPGDLTNANFYVLDHANPININDPSGHDGDVASLEVAMGVESVLAGLVLTGVAASYLAAQHSTAFINAASAATSEIQDLLNSGVASLENEAAVMASNTAAVVNAIDAAILAAGAAAVATWKASASIPPIFPIIRSFGPQVYAFDTACLAANPAWYILNYNGVGSPQTAINRAFVWGIYGGLMATAPAGYELDEFPFAATQQGGPGLTGAGPAIGKPVYWLQNRVQGGLFGAFTRYTLKGKPLAPFLVVPVPL